MIKRLFDFGLSFVCVFLLFPLFFIVPLLLAISLREWPLFFQERAGLNEKPFLLVKFKTMRSISPTSKFNSNIDRVTPFGRLVRKTSLDELPSLFNILRGEMSFVGPRPLLLDYLPFYRGNHRLRHTVKPGLTGLAQVSGRNKITWKKRLDFDVFYVRNQNFLWDLKIIFQTALKIFDFSDVEGNHDLSIKRLDQDLEYIKGSTND
jgi:lipopolysaccharide/colanic/teichoic acid biosynthesis glycosyltransferase